MFNYSTILSKSIEQLVQLESWREITNIFQIVDQFIKYIVGMPKAKQEDSQKLQHNYLIELKAPPITLDQAYKTPKKTRNDFNYIKGEQSHLRRRKMILKDHPQIAKLLMDDKPYTIIIALVVISICIANCYWAKDQPMWILLLDAYLVGGFFNHTLHCCIHDFTHWCGHPNMNVNRFIAILCNIPMGIPSAISFGRYHSDHHNFLNQIKKDPDLPLPWEARISANHKWYKYLFYSIIQLFYALRPIFMHNPSIRLDQIINYIAIIATNYLFYHFWGLNAFIFTIVSGLSSIGPHPAAIHIIAEHYEFIEGQETYDYIGWWNIPNLMLGLHVEHHDFPNCPWWNLQKIREIAPEYYEYLPYHTSYWKVIKQFLSDINFNLYYRTVRIPQNK